MKLLSAAHSFNRSQLRVAIVASVAVTMIIAFVACIHRA